jgi:hypothetical protein
MQFRLSLMQEVELPERVVESANSVNSAAAFLAQVLMVMSLSFLCGMIASMHLSAAK